MGTEHISVELGNHVKADGFNGCAYVARNGEILLSSGYGYSVFDHKVENAVDTKFRIGSITKPFTSFTIMLLEEKAALNTHDLIKKYINDIPVHWDGITIHHLLTHTSGLMHSWDLDSFSATSMTHVTLDEVIESFKKKPVLFSPGEGFQYSGLGYFILAKIIETISHQSYEEVLKELIFQPMNMKNTGCDDYRKVLNKRAFGYVVDHEEIRHDNHIFMPILTGGGNLYSTVEDLANFDIGLNTHSFLSEAGYRKMYTSEKNNYACGWRVINRNGKIEISHSGGVPGFNAYFLRIPTKKICIVTLSNLNRGNSGKNAVQLADDLLEIVARH